DLAALKLGRQDLAGAEEVLKQAAARAPRSPEAQMALGQLYLILQRPSDAEAAFRRAAELDPKNGVALLSVARLQTVGGRNAEAEATFAALSALPDPGYRPLHAVFLLSQGKYEAAVKEFEQQAAAAPADRAARARLIQAYALADRAS